MERVSVVIPTYNSANFLCGALDSVFAQTYPSLEVIVVDDGSSDGTEQCVRERFPNVRFVRQRNAGPASARNTGINLATGDYIAFLDADDRWLPTKIERQVERLHDRPAAGLVFTDHLFFATDGGIREAYSKRLLIMEGDPLCNIISRSGITTSTVMVRRSVLLAVGTFVEDLITAEDDDLWLRVGMAYPLELIDEPLAIYRVHSGGISRNFPKIYDGVTRYLDRLEYSPIYAPLRPRAAAVIHQRRGRLYFDAGVYHFERNEWAQARRDFLTSLRHNPLNMMGLVYWLVSCLPFGVIEKLRRIRRQLRALQ